MISATITVQSRAESIDCVLLEHSNTIPWDSEALRLGKGGDMSAFVHSRTHYVHTVSALCICAQFKPLRKTVIRVRMRVIGAWLLRRGAFGDGVWTNYDLLPPFATFQL